jgi:hypothetical protein
MLRRGQGYRAPGPCAIPGCTYAARGELDAARYGWEWDKPRSPPFVWDHCHVHDYVRGILCRDHNLRIGPVDNQDHYHLQRYAPAKLAALLAYRERCPACVLSGPWHPVMVRHSPALVHRTAHLAEREIQLPEADRILVAQVHGAAKHHARWRELTEVEHATAVAECRGVPYPVAVQLCFCLEGP